MSEQFTALLSDLGRAIGLEGMEADEDGECLLELDGTPVAIAVQEEDQVVLHASVGALAAEGSVREKQMAALLLGNYLFFQTAGATLGADPLTGDIRLAYRRDMAGLDGQGLANLLSGFQETAQYWRNAALPVDTEEPRPRDEGGFPFGGLQA